MSLSQVKQFDFSWEPVSGAEYYQLLENIDSEAPYQMQVAVHEGDLKFLNAHGLTMKAVPRPGIDEDVVASKLEAWLDDAQESGELTPTWDGSRLDLHEVVSWMMMAEGLRPA